MSDFNDFLSVPVAIKAKRMFVDSYQLVSGKNKRVPAGMWLVRAKDGTGQQLALPDDVFREGYRPTDTASEAAWKETTNAIYPHWPSGSPILLS